MSAVEKPHSLEEENALLRSEIAQMQEQLNWFKKQLFGQKSERFIDPSGNQMDLPGIDLPEEADTEEESDPKPKRKRRKRRSTKEDTIQFPDDLPKETVFLDVPEEEKICPETGEPLQKIGEVVIHKLAVKPGSFFLKEIIKPKYASKKNPELGIKIAASPEGIFLKGKADESLLAKIITMKFADHLPLYRIQEIFQRDQIIISRQTLSEWVIASGKALLPLYELMKLHILKHNVIFTDETPVNLLVKGKKKVQKAFMWIYTGGGGLDPPYSIFEFCLTRSHQYPLKTLAGYEGYLHSDKYGAYETLAKVGKVLWCPCMAHIRRYFIEAKTGDQKFCKYVLRYIRYLYLFEKTAKKRNAEERLQIREEKEKPIIQNLILKVKDKLVKGKHLPKSKYRKALGYFMGCSPYLTNYLSHAETHIDNNLSERRLRCLAIGRKNWMFIGSQDGGLATAVLLSLVQTCRHLQINPQEYMEDVLRRIMSHPASKLNELLPDQWQKNRTLIVP